MAIFENFPAFLLIFVRIASFFVTLPLFSYRTMPNILKIGLSFFLAWITFFAINAPVLEINGQYFMLIIKEALVGLLVGFIAYVIMSAIQIAGGFIDFQMGFAMANVIDPQTGAQSPIMGQFLYTFALLLMLGLNAHHLLIDGIYYSYQFVPLGELSFGLGQESTTEFVVKIFNAMFIVAFQMAIPVVGSLFLVDIALGIVARTVPQFNIFVVGLPIKIVVSFIMLFLVMGALFGIMQKIIEMMIRTMRSLLELLGGM
ncbi:flagellar biosynthetic protein FliR [Metabacillus fastidiosus]|uniref:Flagellar biosynthetic protein FliR n=1 Tax=Metabacillus fastidiosus TaxID=1458 RepID=A0ABU6P081_9BACI|nr:flagellar biosynthetic protein FliR [Metabacillus fastidiosus]MED4401516.1 flagellar biosynthetic protein FliR [Metabacillus fastidiosus]MED4452915.1 flagellar biosynthetic protein FliR [Metabacillus fastidiosus]MED4463150.1 flagellar biosynthetic protein FliR [Metabacillus fastidiosus]